ncbi:Flavinator of succinate dehydrogenase-domain-containing protein [Plectosphaerella cucumerina]|uniref:Succinate dehydrogenase assembly factor 2, mitochondrial n=1 Tax=Plectosphaerella cucumerina TaxID=40658 RepID=A0A8K0TF77_9PEZI|nr:Flavinator of succinate dehydrogenase-domain-containing protein [Plectosphaerella cucumerina]
MRARLLCMLLLPSSHRPRLTPLPDQSRKRGILESDLLMSTFANAMLPTMTKQQMVQYDLFLDENDWDIYYWATQDESPGPDTTPTNPPKAKSLESSTTAGAESYHGVGAGAEKTIDAGTSGNADPPVPQDVQVRVRKDGEWAQTIGTFKPAYRPVPARWKDSEILLMLREHVRSRRADTDATGEGRGRETPAAEAGKGMGFMPPLFEMKR